MNYNTEKNNKVFIMGEVVSEATFSHEVYGEGFYDLNVRVMRLSGQADVLPVTVSERLITDGELKIGATLCALGQFRSYNKIENGKSRLMLTVFVRELVDMPPSKNPNSIVLSGYICKPPVYRTTPFNREIADLLVAVNRAYNKSDYIPCIAWGRNARFVKNLQVGDKIALSGAHSKPRISEKTQRIRSQNDDRLRSFGLQTRRFRQRRKLRSGTRIQPLLLRKDIRQRQL